MTLLEPQPEPSHKRRHLRFVAGALLILAAVVLYLTFRFYPEQRAAQKFFDALAAGDNTKAYQLWQAAPSYRFPDFLTDWGPNGYYGPVKSYKIMKVKAADGSASSVVVEVALSPFAPLPEASDAEKSRRTKVVTVWMNTENKAFSFPP